MFVVIICPLNYAVALLGHPLPCQRQPPDSSPVSFLYRSFLRFALRAPATKPVASVRSSALLPVALLSSLSLPSPSFSHSSVAMSPRSMRHCRYSLTSLRQWLVFLSCCSKHFSYASANCLHSARWSSGKLPFAGGFGARAAPDRDVDVVISRNFTSDSTLLSGLINHSKSQAGAQAQIRKI